MATEKEVKDMDKRITALEIYFKVALGVAAVFGLSGAVIFSQLTRAREQITDLQSKVNTIKPVVDQSIKRIEEAGQEEAGKLAAKTESYLQGTVDKRLKSLGQARDGVTFDVTNPRMKGLKAACPVGTFVSAVSAPTGVGGDYGTDGISKINVVCSALLNAGS